MADKSLQRALPLHRQFRALHPGRSPAEPRRRGRFSAFRPAATPPASSIPLRWSPAQLGVPLRWLRSKSWDEFAQADAPPMDFVFTVCDNAAGETCPFWPGQPMTAHWGMPDPAAVEGSDDEKRLEFRDTAVTLKRRIDLLLALPIESLDAMAIQPSSGTSEGDERSAGRPRWPKASERRSARGRDRLRDHGRAAGGRKRRHRAARQCAGDGWRPLHADRGFRPDQRRALQSGGVARDGARRQLGPNLLPPMSSRNCSARCSVRGSRMRCSTPLLQFSTKVRSGPGNGSPKAWPPSAWCS